MLLSSHMKFAQKSPPSHDKYEDCMHLIREALNVTENFERVFSLMSDVAEADNLNHSVEAFHELLLALAEQQHFRDFENWGHHWSQSCACSLKLINNLKYDLIAARENFKNCKDYFHKSRISASYMQRLLKTLDAQKTIISETVEKAEDYMKGSANTSRWTLQVKFSDYWFGVATRFVKDYRQKVYRSASEFFEEVETGLDCIVLSCEQFVNNSILPSTWDVVKELEIIKEIQGNTSFVLPKGSAVDILHQLLEDYKSSSEKKMSVFEWFSWLTQRFLTNVDKIDSVFELFKAKIKLDESNFK